MLETLGQLLDTPDHREQIRDQIGGILRANFDEQVSLGGENAYVFSERLNPWEQLHQNDTTPIVNISVQDAQYDGAISSAVNHQKATARYNVDCIAFAESRGTAGGHEPGDEQASLEAQRVGRVCRQILMSPQNAYLQLRGTVWKRWVQSSQVLQPPSTERPVTHVVVERLVLSVEFTESSPEVGHETLEIVNAQIERASDGAILVEAQYDYSEG